MKKGLKGIAAVTLFCFMATQCVSAAPGAGIEMAGVRELPSYLSIDVPAELGTVDALYEAPAGANPQFILHIQNAHANYQAQMKIKDLLGYMNKKYGFKTIFVEGASEKLDADYLRLFPDQERNLKLCDELAKQGELTGAELFLMEQGTEYGEKNTVKNSAVPARDTPYAFRRTQNAVEAFGIENAALYRQNYDALKKVFGAEADVTRFFKEFDGKLDKVSSKTFTSETRELIADWKRFEQGRRDFLPFVRSLAAKSKKIMKVDLESLFAQVGWPQITRLLVIQQMEKDLNKAKGVEEQAALVKMLRTKHVSKELLTTLENFTEGSFAVGKSTREVSPREVLERLNMEAGPKGFKFSDYPAFSLYAGYVTLRSELDPKVLYDEIEYLFTQMLDTLTGEPEQKALLALYRDGELLRKLLHLELNRAQWRELLERKESIAIPSLVARLRNAVRTSATHNAQRATEKGDSLSVARSTLRAPGKALGAVMPPVFAKTMDELFTAGLEFYDYAHKREAVFYKEIETAMTERKITKAILITGGFHTDGMSDMFRDNAVSYGIVTPRLSEKSDENLYRKIMMQNRQYPFEVSYLEKFLNGAQSFDAQIRQGGREAIHDYVATRVHAITTKLGYGAEQAVASLNDFFDRIAPIDPSTPRLAYAGRSEVRIVPRGGEEAVSGTVLRERTVPAKEMLGPVSVETGPMASLRAPADRPSEVRAPLSVKQIVIRLGLAGFLGVSVLVGSVFWGRMQDERVWEGYAKSEFSRAEANAAAVETERMNQTRLAILEGYMIDYRVVVWYVPGEEVDFQSKAPGAVTIAGVIKEIKDGKVFLDDLKDGIPINFISNVTPTDRSELRAGNEAAAGTAVQFSERTVFLNKRIMQITKGEWSPGSTLESTLDALMNSLAEDLASSLDTGGARELSQEIRGIIGSDPTVWTEDMRSQVMNSLRESGYDAENAVRQTIYSHVTRADVEQMVQLLTRSEAREAARVETLIKQIVELSQREEQPISPSAADQSFALLFEMGGDQSYKLLNQKSADQCYYSLALMSADQRSVLFSRMSKDQRSALLSWISKNLSEGHRSALLSGMSVEDNYSYLFSLDADPLHSLLVRKSSEDRFALLFRMSVDQRFALFSKMSGKQLFELFDGMTERQMGDLLRPIYDAKKSLPLLKEFLAEKIAPALLAKALQDLLDVRPALSSEELWAGAGKFATPGAWGRLGIIGLAAQTEAAQVYWKAYENWFNKLGPKRELVRQLERSVVLDARLAIPEMIKQLELRSRSEVRTPEEKEAVARIIEELEKLSKSTMTEADLIEALAALAKAPTWKEKGVIAPEDQARTALVFLKEYKKWEVENTPQRKHKSEPVPALNPRHAIKGIIDQLESNGRSEARLTTDDMGAISQILKKVLAAEQKKLPKERYSVQSVPLVTLIPDLQAELEQLMGGKMDAVEKDARERKIHDLLLEVTFPVGFKTQYNDMQTILAAGGRSEVRTKELGSQEQGEIFQLIKEVQQMLQTEWKNFSNRNVLTLDRQPLVDAWVKIHEILAPIVLKGNVTLSDVLAIKATLDGNSDNELSGSLEPLIRRVKQALDVGSEDSIKMTASDESEITRLKETIENKENLFKDQDVAYAIWKYSLIPVDAPQERLDLFVGVMSSGVAYGPLAKREVLDYWEFLSDTDQDWIPGPGMIQKIHAAISAGLKDPSSDVREVSMQVAGKFKGKFLEQDLPVLTRSEVRATELTSEEQGKIFSLITQVQEKFLKWLFFSSGLYKEADDLLDPFFNTIKSIKREADVTPEVVGKIKTAWGNIHKDGRVLLSKNAELYKSLESLVSLVKRTLAVSAVLKGFGTSADSLRQSLPGRIILSALVAAIGLLVIGDLALNRISIMLKGNAPTKGAGIAGAVAVPSYLPSGITRDDFKTRSEVRVRKANAEEKLNGLKTSFDEALVKDMDEAEKILEEIKTLSRLKGWAVVYMDCELARLSVYKKSFKEAIRTDLAEAERILGKIKSLPVITDKVRDDVLYKYESDLLKAHEKSFDETVSKDLAEAKRILSNIKSFPYSPTQEDIILNAYKKLFDVAMGKQDLAEAKKILDSINDLPASGSQDYVYQECESMYKKTVGGQEEPEKESAALATLKRLALESKAVVERGSHGGHTPSVGTGNVEPVSLISPSPSGVSRGEVARSKKEARPKVKEEVLGTRAKAWVNVEVRNFSAAPEVDGKDFVSQLSSTLKRWGVDTRSLEEYIGRENATLYLDIERRGDQYFLLGFYSMFEFGSAGPERFREIAFSDKFSFGTKKENKLFTGFPLELQLKRAPTGDMYIVGFIKPFRSETRTVTAATHEKAAGQARSTVEERQALAKVAWGILTPSEQKKLISRKFVVSVESLADVLGRIVVPLEGVTAEQVVVMLRTLLMPMMGEFDRSKFIESAQDILRNPVVAISDNPGAVVSTSASKLTPEKLEEEYAQLLLNTGQFVRRVESTKALNAMEILKLNQLANDISMREDAKGQPVAGRFRLVFAAPGKLGGVIQEQASDLKRVIEKSSDVVRVVFLNEGVVALQDMNIIGTQVYSDESLPELSPARSLAAKKASQRGITLKNWNEQTELRKELPDVFSPNKQGGFDINNSVLRSLGLVRVLEAIMTRIATAKSA